jgi:hypothetical protein
LCTSDLPGGFAKVKRFITSLVILLFVFSAAIITYRIVWLGYPAIPAAPGQTWHLSIDAHVKTDGKGINMSLGIPVDCPWRMFVEERIYSGTLNFNILSEGQNRFALWSGGQAAGVGMEESIFYHATILMLPKRFYKAEFPDSKEYMFVAGDEEKIVARRLTGKWDNLSSPERIDAIAGTVAGKWGRPGPDKNDLEAWSVMEEKHGKAKALLMLYQSANIPARESEGLFLRETATDKLSKWVEVWDGKRWLNVWAETGNIYEDQTSFLSLVSAGVPAVRMINGEIGDIRWVLVKSVTDRWGLHAERTTRSKSFLDKWSLFRLPPEFQRTFRILLLVPIGALMISILRNVVGFPTFGIFMPVLMALSFRNTGLIYGLGIFFGVILLGYFVRSFLDKLRLLLVPRMSVMLTLVIGGFTILALIGNKFGLKEFMAVGLLPFVILTMIIERFFVLVEESGTLEAFRTACGSAAVAALTYMIISWEPLQLTFFVYPELLLAIVGIQILIGRYTGYRISEFIRFRALKGS